MVDAIMQSAGDMNSCDCCAGLSVSTPVAVVNASGLPAIAYRVGIYNQFKQSMLAGLSGANQAGLADLTTRSDDDFSIALLDAWAVVADILTFYQERIANESYLRTATERLSILELARSIGYELSPGVDASVYLAFTIDDSLGAPIQTTIGAGTQVQSVPAPGQQPQTFETSAPIQARAAWNTLQPRLTMMPRSFTDPNTGDLLSIFYFDGLQTGLNLGDCLLLLVPGEMQGTFCQVTGISPQPAQRWTAVGLQQIGMTAESLGTSSSASPQVRANAAFRSAPGSITRGTMRVALNSIQPQGIGNLPGDLNPTADGAPSTVTQKYLGAAIDSKDLDTAAIVEDFVVVDIFNNSLATQPPPPGVLVFRTRAPLFGNNAPPFGALPANLVESPDGKKTGLYGDREKTWADATLATYLPYLRRLHPPALPDDSWYVFLDTTYQNIVPNSYVVLRDDTISDDKKSGLELHQVAATSELSWSDFTLNTRVTRLQLSAVSGDNLNNFGIRTTSVYGPGEMLSLARLPITDLVLAGQTLDLDGLVDGLYVGQGLLLCGEPDSDRGNTACEYVTIENIVYQSDGYTSLTLGGTGLQNSYVRETVTINGNVAPATQGATRQEVLGSGDGRQAYQSFTLSQSPLTFTSSQTASGTQSSLNLYVNNVLWQEVPAFYGHGQTEHIYITRIGDDGTVTVQCSDGTSGARFPTGRNNVRAVYRNGTGESGLVAANQLTTLLTRSAGVRAVTNPQAAAGAVDPEGLDDARQNAPLQVLTIDRIVSLRDYQDFASAFAGVAKALATWTWDGQRRGVFVTVAGPGGAAIDDGSILQQNLLAAMRNAGDSLIPLQVRSYLKRLFRVTATVKIDPAYIQDQVSAALNAALRAAFSFDARTFGQPVTMSEMIAVMQPVSGVIGVTATSFYRSYPLNLSEEETFVLTASVPSTGSGAGVSAAELLTLDPAPLALTITT